MHPPQILHFLRGFPNLPVSTSGLESQIKHRNPQCIFQNHTLKIKNSVQSAHCVYYQKFHRFIRASAQVNLRSTTFDMSGNFSLVILTQVRVLNVLGSEHSFHSAILDFKSPLKFFMLGCVMSSFIYF